MKATKNGWTVEGTPMEIVELIKVSAYGDTSGKAPVQTPAAVETADATPKPTRRAIDWKKAQALRDAGWDYKKIADEIGSTYASVYAKLNKKSI